MPRDWLASVQADLKACIIEGCSIVFNHNFELEVRAVMPNDGEASAKLNCANIVASLTMKGLALYRMKDKDSLRHLHCGWLLWKRTQASFGSVHECFERKELEKTTIDAVRRSKMVLRHRPLKVRVP